MNPFQAPEGMRFAVGIGSVVAAIVLAVTHLFSDTVSWMVYILTGIFVTTAIVNLR